MSVRMTSVRTIIYKVYTYIPLYMHDINYVLDVRTQAMYQMMDERFVGLIFSLFNEDKQTKVSVATDIGQ